MNVDQEFWEYLDRLATTCPLVIDRPRGSAHPRFSQAIYPLDYGYLAGTVVVDGGGLDVWVGSLPEKTLTALVLTIDLEKRDAEIKLLLGCSALDQQAVLAFHQVSAMRAMLVSRPSETA